jgi:hypothetical protein
MTLNLGQFPEMRFYPHISFSEIDLQLSVIFDPTPPFTGVCLLLQDLLQRCLRGGGRIVEDMCYERLRAEACVD